ncbi:hypothetical protein CTAYLR_009066 [Chrysophaeum taylorii]|uniref:Protein transport protein SEC24 n=1 Tax=Chrysophaeum taylorii TaxID=2483200 RepID=A0AAD7UKG0_9STRA|nr:hypothetical protein CTAYLR_009066 [Chrysophaeum taylorii]
MQGDGRPPRGVFGSAQFGAPLAARGPIARPAEAGSASPVAQAGPPPPCHSPPRTPPPPMAVPPAPTNGGAAPTNGRVAVRAPSRYAATSPSRYAATSPPRYAATSPPRSRSPKKSPRQQQRINPSQMPRPSVGEVEDGDTEPARLVTGGEEGESPRTPRVAPKTYRPCHPRDEGLNAALAPAPPPPSSKFIAVAGTNCSPRYARCTTHRIARTREDLAATQLPMALSAQPLASRRDPNEPRVPAVDCSDESTRSGGPPRCARCQGYVNPYVTWSRSKKRHGAEEVTVWTCNLCGHENRLADKWYDELRQRDKVLESPSVDFIVNPADYCVRPVQAPVCVLAIDAACAGVVAGKLVVRDGRRRYGIALFGASVYFAFAAKPAATIDEVNVVEVSDVDDPFCPLAPDAWLCGADAAAAILKLLPALAAAIDASRQNACVAAIEAVADGLSERGGKLCVVTSSGPTRGLGADFFFDESTDPARSKNKNKNQNQNQNKNRTRATAAAAAAGPPPPGNYEELAKRLSSRRVSVDVFCIDDQPSRLDASAAALGRVCEPTGGRLRYHAAADAALAKNLDLATSWLSDRPRGSRELRLGSAHECVFKVRCSRGLRVARYYGAGIGGDVVETFEDATRDSVACDATHVVACDLEHDSADKLEGDVAYLQLALLYSDALADKRVVRVHNLALAVSSKPSDIYRYADVETVFATLVKRSLLLGKDDVPAGAETTRRDGIKRWTAARDSLVDDCVAILQNYRATCAPRSPSGQLILPESVKLLPLLCLGALKGPLLRDDSSPGLPLRRGSPRQQRHPFSVERAALVSRALSAPVDEIVRLAYPRLYELPPSSDDDVVRAVATTSHNLEPDRAYLLDAGHAIFVYVGPRVDDARRDELVAIFFDTDRPDWLLADDIASIYDDDTSADLSCRRSRFSHTTPEADRLRSLVAMLVEYRSSCPPLRLVLPRDGDDPRDATFPPRPPNQHDDDDDANGDHADFLNRLVEDKTHFGASYVDFLCSVHREIQTRISSRT